MPVSLRRRVGFVLLPALAVVAGCASMLDGLVMGAVSAPHSAVRVEAPAMPGDPHTAMTVLGPDAPGDRARADALLDEARRSLVRYRRVEAAEADGYRPFPSEPPPELRVIHYVHRSRSRAEARRVDVTRPGSLLYERDGDGGLRLVGFMVTAPVDATPAELDARVPLSVTQWHLHQNVCVPRPVWDRDAWARTLPSGARAFGPGSAIATEAACEAEGGRFLPTVFGWMAHVHVFAEDPADTWNAMYGHDGHHQTGPDGRHGHHHDGHSSGRMQ